jgi:hypothetical protein
MPQKWTQAGVKRIITEAFKNHKATIWVMGGHNHTFAEKKYGYEGVTYMQTDTTSSSALDWAFGDNRNPGYMIIALQDGKVLCRLFRSTKETGFQVRPAISQMSTTPIQFMFDALQYPTALYEEGFYDHSGKVIEYNAAHVGSYFAYCKSIVIRVNPSDYFGGIAMFVVSGYISSSVAPLCSMSLSGEDGSWVSVSFPPAKGSGLYSVAISSIFLNSSGFFVKLDNGLTGSTQGFKMSGWALISDTSQLTGYEKWISKHYRSLEKSDEIDPDSDTPETDYSNIINFGFNLLQAETGSISGLPCAKTIASVGLPNYISLSFARMKADSNSGISYDLERSYNMKDWELIPLEEFEERVLQNDGSWEKVECKMYGEIKSKQFYRVNLKLLSNS